ncbi:cell wall-binding repeat-containing protein [Rossellomorea aquimaris]|uniref:cell wall-binding repeat-containing protein n=1 Tax=Rossellomorea aquimaris TaxID=189382 RepID=UPI001CD1A15F|nr:cell wall-binding repeat-containing protein [Rossellomorea aquimaris]MCA1060874.1 cell wall-binding repeat-containing protein [Rossellomorea aquimaris]
MKIPKIFSTLLALVLFSSTYTGVASGNEVTYGECEMTISVDDVYFENSVPGTNYCEPVVNGYFAAGNFWLSGTYSGEVDYSGQQFEVSNPFSPNVHEILTVHLVGQNGEPVNDYIRFSGKSRLDTAIEVSNRGWPTGLIFPPEKAVILARADEPADALAASSLSGAKDAPILLTYPDKIEQSVLNELKRLKPENIYLLGGTSAINGTVENKLKNLGYNVKRVSGTNRFETAAKINDIVLSVNKQNTKAIIANGYTVADALSASASAATQRIPIYLATKDRSPVILPDNITSVDVYGGTSVISDSLVNSIKSKGITVNRIAGVNRYETSMAAAEKQYNGPLLKVILVRGESVSATKQDYPDAVVASALAHKYGTKLLLVHPTSSNEEIKDYLQSLNAYRVFVLGGENAIPDDVIQDLGLE